MRARLLAGAGLGSALALIAACAPREAPAPQAAADRAPAPPSVAAPARTEAAEPEAATAGEGEPAPDEWVVFETEPGEIWLDLFEELTPGHAENFKKLVRQGYYDGSPFHRVIPGFVAQGGGQWAGEGRTGDVGYTLPPEIHPELRHVRGALAAARLGDARNPGRRSSGSQFYICLRAQPQLDRQYTVFGQVIRGLEAVDAIRSGPPGREGAVAPGEATVVQRAYLRTPNEPGSRSAVHEDHH